MSRPGPLVLLDLDGTLMDSAPGILDSARSAYRDLGLALPTEAELRSFVGPPITHSFASHGVPPEQVTAAIAHYRRAFAAGGMWNNSVFPGIPEQLAALRAAGCTLAVATSKPEEYARPICDHYGLSDLVDGVYGAPADHIPSSKATVIAHALTELGAGALGRAGRVPPAGQIVMVGDRFHDVEGAAEHGIECLGVGWGYAEPGELSGAIGIIARIDDLAEVVLGRLGERRPAQRAAR